MRVVNIQNIDERGFLHPPLKEIALPAGAERYMVMPGDILLIARGAQTRTALATDAIKGAIAGSGLIVIRPEPELLAHVLLAHLQSDEGQRALRRRIRSSTLTRLLTLKDVYELPVPVPPMRVQHQIAELTDAAETGYQAALRAAEKRREFARAVIARLLHDDALLRGAGS
jgi:restriction endonuclease S subunit